MPAAPDLGYAFGLPPAQAIAYFQSLGHEITFDWRETADAVKAKAVAVSNAARLDVLADLRNGLQRVLDEGLTERDFVNELTPILQSKGWWGTQMATDAQGGAARIQLGSPSRLKTIFRTNLQTAMMAGRWRDFMGNVEDRPYFQYLAVMDSRTRPTHAAMNGRVYRYDDPVWRTHWPPWAYNCRCRVRALSAAALKRNGLQVSSSAGHLVDIEQPWGVDQRTGEVISRLAKALRVIGPNGKPMEIGPSPGFGFNPGMGEGFDPIGNIPDIPPGAPTPPEVPTAIAAMARMLPDQPTWRTLGRPDLRNVPTELRVAAPELLPAQPDLESATRVLAQALDVSLQHPTRLVQTPIEQVALTFDLLRHEVEKRADARERYANFVLPTLTLPFEVWLTQYDDGSVRRRYIGVFTGQRNLLVVVRVNADGAIVWNYMHGDDKRLNALRVGDLVWAKDRPGGPDK